METGAPENHKLWDAAIRLRQKPCSTASLKEFKLDPMACPN